MMAFLQRIRFSSGAWHFPFSVCAPAHHRPPIRLGLQKYLIVVLFTIAKSASTDRDHQDDKNTHKNTQSTDRYDEDEDEPLSLSSIVATKT